MKKFLGSLSGYLYDEHTNLVYSTKRRGTKPPLPLEWQRSNRYGKYIILTTTHNDHFRLLYSEINTPAFANLWFGEPQVPAATPSSTGLFMVSYAPRPNMSKVHTDEQSARDDAERLAKAHPGKGFVVSEIKGTVSAGNVVWE